MSAPPKAITVFTHAPDGRHAGASAAWSQLAREAGVEVHVPREEVGKHGLDPRGRRGARRGPDGRTDLARGARRRRHDPLHAAALRRAASVPVFAVNFGAIGFLATVEPRRARGGHAARAGGRLRRDGAARRSWPTRRRASARRERHVLPPAPERARGGARLLGGGRGARRGALRRPRGRHPGGSTGYNLANGGPVLAWGVEGFVVSFIAPHTLTARALVVAPGRPARGRRTARARRRST